jgi:hypothetical protein
VYRAGGAGFGWVGTGAVPVPLNQWSHVAGVYDGTNLSLYVNGSLAGSPVFAPGQIVPSAKDLQIGHDPSNPALYFNGLIDEASVYGTALSAAQIEAIYAAASAGKCPSPPVVALQPRNQAVFAGQTVSFAVTVNGLRPLSYLWLLDGTNISVGANATATSAVLVLTNVPLGQSGGLYSVFITNQIGATPSFDALLTVLAPGSCLPPPAGLVGWWAGESNANDSYGTNNGILVGGATFTNGEVGRAFSLNGTSQYVDVPDSPGLNPVNSVTLEAWIYPRQFPAFAPVIKKAGENTTETDHGYGLDLVGTGSGVQFSVYLSLGVAWVRTGVAPVPLNQWSHVAGIYDGTNLSLYVNGSLAGSPVNAPGQIVSSVNDLQIGHDPSDSSRFFNGFIDEAGVYGTALPAAQILAIYNAGIAGKCHTTPPLPPTLLSGSSTTNGQVQFQLQGDPGVTFTIESSTDLVNWITLTNILDANGLVSFYVSVTNPHQFYRATWSPQQ